MKKIRIGIGAMLVAAATLLGALPGNASTFFAWAVIDVPAWDTLNVRAYPSPQSKILVAYPNGVIVSLTGKCTGGVHLDAINGWAAWQQRQAVRYEWCEAWVDAHGDGQYRTGWAYGKFLRPA